MLKISTALLICYSWDSTLVYFLSSLLPAHPLIFPSRAKSLSSRHPRKPSATILIKHLAAERAVFVFTNVTNPIEPHSLLPRNQISVLVWFIQGQIARGEVDVNKSLLQNFSLSFVRRLFEPTFVETSVQHLICDCEIPLVRHWFCYSELSNGNLVECCGTSSTHSPIV